MKKLLKYKHNLINLFILSLLAIGLYFLGKSTINIYLRVIIGLILGGFFISVFLNFKDVFLKIKENYGDMAARLFKEAIQKINSVFIGF